MHSCGTKTVKCLTTSKLAHLAELHIVHLMLSGQIADSLLNKTNAIRAYPVHEEIPELASDLDEADTWFLPRIK